MPQAFAQEGDQEPDVAELFYNEGLKQYILGDYAGAIDDFKAAAQLRPNSEKYRNMYLNALVKKGSSDFEAGNLEAAKRYYSEALVISESDPELARRLELVRGELTAEGPSSGQDQTNEEPSVQPSPESPDIDGSTMQPTPPVVQVEWPFDVEEFIERRNSENMRILDEVLQVQREERENLFRNMELMAETQREDRMFFGRSLTIAVAGIGALVFLPLLAVVLLVVMRRRNSPSETAVLTSSTQLPEGSQLLLDAGEHLDETDTVDRENYSQISRAIRLRELYQELMEGNLDWDVLSGYINELNEAVKHDILKAVERKLESSSTADMASSMSILMPLVTDESEQIRKRSKNLATGLSGLGDSSSSLVAGDSLRQLEQLSEKNDPLSLAALLQVARLVDNKTGNACHSVRVAKYACRIAERVGDPAASPLDAERVALVHDIGYLDIDDALFRKEGPLTRRQFDVMKTHTERGVRLLAYANPPQLFLDGIRYHHERTDGSGYPEGLREDEIPLIARIIAVADCFCALTSPRPYRKRQSMHEALKTMEEMASGLLDRTAMRILADIVSEESEDAR